MPSITLNLNVENAPNPAQKHFEKTNSQNMTDAVYINKQTTEKMNDNDCETLFPSPGFPQLQDFEDYGTFYIMAKSLYMYFLSY